MARMGDVQCLFSYREFLANILWGTHNSKCSSYFHSALQIPHVLAHSNRKRLLCTYVQQFKIYTSYQSKYGLVLLWVCSKVVTLESEMSKEWIKTKNVIKIQRSISLSQWGQNEIVRFKMEKEIDADVSILKKNMAAKIIVPVWSVWCLWHYIKDDLYG